MKQTHSALFQLSIKCLRPAGLLFPRSAISSITSFDMEPPRITWKVCYLAFPPEETKSYQLCLGLWIFIVDRCFQAIPKTLPGSWFAQTCVTFLTKQVMNMNSHFNDFPLGRKTKRGNTSKPNNLNQNPHPHSHTNLHNKHKTKQLTRETSGKLARLTRKKTSAVRFVARWLHPLHHAVLSFPPLRLPQWLHHNVHPPGRGSSCIRSFPVETKWKWPF